MSNFIEISYKNRHLPAEVIYNFQQISDVIVINFLIPESEQDRSVLFVRYSNKCWKELTPFSAKNPECFHKLSQHLAEIFMKEGYCFCRGEHAV